MDSTLTDLEVFNKNKLITEGEFVLGGRTWTAEEVVQAVAPLLTEERKARIEQVLSHRSFKVATVLENVYDRGNISAVMRSAESFGFLPFHIIEAEQARFKPANRVTKGSEKWLAIEVHRQVPSCINLLRRQNYKVYATHLKAHVSIDEIDFTQPTAVVFGNEKEGVSEEMLQHVDACFKVPMVGFSQSFNISVAAALTLYHAFYRRCRQLGKSGDLSAEEQLWVRANYYLRCLDKPEQTVQIKV